MPVQPNDAAPTSPDQYRALVEASSEGLLLTDVTGLILLANPAAMALYGGATPEELLHHNLFDVVIPEDRSRAQEHLWATLERDSVISREYTVRRQDGTMAIIEVSTVLLRTTDGQATGLIAGSVRDVTAQKQAEEALRLSELRLRTVIGNAPIILFAVDRAGVITLSEGQGLAVLGRLSGEDVVGRSVFEVYRDHPAILDHTRRALAGDASTAMIELAGAVLETRYTPVRDVDGRIGGLVGVATDVTERSRAEEILRHHALHDSLTGLPNGTLLRDRLQQALLTAQRNRTTLALVLLDPRRVKEVNATLGHDAGDLLLRQVAGRAQGVVRAADTVARLGGDAFVILLPGAQTAGAMWTARKILRAFDEPFDLGGQRLSLGASMGIALYPEHGTDAPALLRSADSALAAAKSTGVPYFFYDPQHDRHSSSRLMLMSELRQAIAQDQLILHFQPKVHLKKGIVSGVEALARWPHPERGFLPPDQFIELAEQTDLITPLTHWALEYALRQCALWRQDKLHLSVAVNLSMHNVHDPQMPERVAALLRRYAIPASALTLEITESTMMADPTRTLAVLTRLAALGVRFAIDDFGTGYSSLGHLSRLPVHEMKIDRSFVRGLATQVDTSRDVAVVRAMIELGHSLGVTVVAEGVEDRLTWEILGDLGCDVIQGYHISPALPAEELARWMRVSLWGKRTPAG